KGMLTDAEHIRRAMLAVRGMEVTELGTAGVHLLARRGEATDLEWVADLLDHEDMALRLAAGEGLAKRSEGVDPLVKAAAGDPALFGVAATGLAQHRRSQAGFEALLSLPAPSPDVRLERIRAMLSVLPTVVICDVGCAEADPSTREIILSH